MDNLFADISDDAPNELFDVLIQNRSVRIERIVSTGQSSPEGFWYEQSETEWVAVLSGEATLRYENQPDVILLKRGDYIEIPAQTRHRVESTCGTEPTIWLAIFYDPNKNSTN